MNSALVSIIMPVYQAEEFIEKSILSVMEQTYPNIELICINDGTRDKSFEICQNLSKEYSNIILLQNEVHQVDGVGETRNHGQEYTRNHGLQYAQGRYVMFLDSDDTLKPTTVEKLVAIAEENQTDVLVFTYTTIQGGKETPVLCPNMPIGNYTASKFVKHILTDMSYAVCSCVGSKLYRMDFIKEHEIFFDKRYKYNEDAAFILTCLMYNPNIYYLDEPFYQYYIRTNGSTMSSYRSNQITSLLQTRRLLKQLFVEHGVWDEKMHHYDSANAGLLLSVVSNAALFGTKQDYKKTFGELKSCEELKELKEKEISSLSLNRNVKMLVKLMLKGKKWSVYYLLRLRKCLK